MRSQLCTESSRKKHVCLCGNPKVNSDFLPCTCLCFLHTTTTGIGCVVVYQIEVFISYFVKINPLNAELNPICHQLALLGAHHIFHVSGLRVNGDYTIGWLFKKPSSNRKDKQFIPLDYHQSYYKFRIYWLFCTMMARAWILHCGANRAFLFVKFK
jgi:hypothetical protein